MSVTGQDHRQLRVLHWNVHSWRDTGGAANVEAVADLVRETDPHVVSLVEVDEPWGMPGALRDVAERCGYSWIFMPSFAFGGTAPAGGFGNALLTTLPVRAVQQWPLLWPTPTFDGTEPSEPRSLVAARLDFAAYERRSLVVSSNLHPSGFDEIMPKTLATATVDRLLHHAHVVVTQGDSFRLAQATSGQGVKALN